MITTVLTSILVYELSPMQENFVKLTVILDIVAENLRAFFTEKWNGQYPMEKWKSNASSGSQLYDKLPKGFRDSRPNKEYIAKMKAGDEQQWDITTLCKVLLDSGLNLIQDCRPTGERHGSLLPRVEIGNIRKIRNGFFAHLPKFSCSDNDFAATISKIKTAARRLFGVHVEQIINGIEKSPIDCKIIKKVGKLVEQEISQDAKKVDEKQLKGNYLFKI